MEKTDTETEITTIRIPLSEFSLLYRCFITLDGIIEYSEKDKEVFDFMIESKMKTGIDLCKEYKANYEKNR